MTAESWEYNIAAIRSLLRAAFTAEDLRRFCLDDPFFRPICDRFGPGQGLVEMVDHVIDYCRTRRLLPQLLAAVQQARPDVYARHEPHLRFPAPTTDVPTSPPVSPEPTLDDGIPPRGSDPAIPPPRDTEPPLWKTVLSKPIVWLVLAVLILLGER